MPCEFAFSSLSIYHDLESGELSRQLIHTRRAEKLHDPRDGLIDQFMESLFPPAPRPPFFVINRGVLLRHLHLRTNHECE